MNYTRRIEMRSAARIVIESNVKNKALPEAKTKNRDCIQKRVA
jgi:hypothetical protein